jgi:glycosyltransferase involved in cell wall biosynthesis
MAYEKIKMHVCMISGSYPPLRDGIGDYTFKLIEALGNYDIKISLITSLDRQINSYISPKGNLSIFPIVKSWNIDFLCVILRLIKREKFDIIHIQYPNIKYRRTLFFCFLPFLIRTFFKEIKVVTTLHEFSIAYPINKIRQIMFSLFSNRVVVTDEKDLQGLAKFLGDNKTKIKIIPIGSNIDVYGHQPQGRKIFLKERGLKEDTVIISFFGNIHRDKGLEYLLQAFAGLTQKKFLLHLVIISQLDPVGNKYHNKIKQLFSSLDIEKLIFLSGYIGIEKVSHLLSLSDICVLPFIDGVSLRRGSLMAALAHGKAVISTKPNDSADRGLFDKKNILFVPINDVYKLSEALELLYKDTELREKIGQEAGKTAALFSWDKIANKHIGLYLDILRKDFEK